MILVLNLFRSHGALTFCALVTFASMVAYGQNGDVPSIGLQEKPALVQFDDAPNTREIPVDPYRWDAGLDRFEAFATPGMSEYGRTKELEMDSVAPAIVPEPGSMVLLAGGLAVFAVRRMRRSA
jgi:hypothetical protein